MALTIHPSHILAWALGSCPIPIKPSVSPSPTTLRIRPHSAHPSPSRISWDSSHWVLGKSVETCGSGRIGDRWGSGSLSLVPILGRSFKSLLS